MTDTWRIGRDRLRTLRGMIIDRNKGWGANVEMAPVIEAAIQNRLKNIDEETYSSIYVFLRYGPMDASGTRQPLRGTYETCGLDCDQMQKAWNRYIRKYKVVLVPK